MVHLKNILRIGSKISCLYSPEKNGEYGYLEYDSNTKEINYKKTSTDKDTEFYSSAVKHKLTSMIKDEIIPEEYNLFIY